MKHHTHTLLVAACLSIISQFWAGAAPARAQVLEVPDVVTQFREWSFRTDPMGFWCLPPFSPEYSFTANSENHWQGIARHPDPSVPILYLIGSRDYCTTLSIVKIGSADVFAGSRLRSNRLWYSSPSFNTPPPTGDRIVGEISIPDSHGGGMQIAGHYLAIPLGSRCDGENTEIRIYDISNPLLPTHAFTIPTTSKGIVGFTQLDDGRYLIVATAFDNTSLQFYTLDSQFATFTQTNWTPDQLDTSIIAQPWPLCNQFNYCIQSLQLVNPAGESPDTVYMIGFHQVSLAAPLLTGQNLTWLFRVTLGATSVAVQTVTIHELKTSPVDGNGFDNGNFSAASGLFISPAGEMIAYTTEHYINFNNSLALDNVVVMSEFASRRGVFPPSAPGGGACIAHVELATGTNFAGRVLRVDAMDVLYENYGALAQIDGGYANNITSVVWTLPVGCTCRLYAGPNYSGNYLDLVGNGGSSLFGDLSSVGWSNGAPGSPANNIQSLRFLGNYPSPTVPGDPAIPLTAIASNVTPGPCALVKFRAGNYPGAATFRRQCQFRNVDLGDVRLGGGTP